MTRYPDPPEDLIDLRYVFQYPGHHKTRLTTSPKVYRPAAPASAAGVYARRHAALQSLQEYTLAGTNSPQEYTPATKVRGSKRLSGDDCDLNRSRDIQSSPPPPLWLSAYDILPCSHRSRRPCGGVSCHRCLRYGDVAVPVRSLMGISSDVPFAESCGDWLSAHRLGFVCPPVNTTGQRPDSRTLGTPSSFWCARCIWIHSAAAVYGHITAAPESNNSQPLVSSRCSCLRAVQGLRPGRSPLIEPLAHANL